jgi:hypothetical protein
MLLSTWIVSSSPASLIAISPGSGAVLSMSHGLAYGLKKASATVLGLQLGLMLVLVIAGAGVGSLVLASESGLHRRQDRRRAVPDLARHRPVALESEGERRADRRPGRPPRPSASAC